MNQLSIGFVMDPFENLKPQKDSTLAIMREALSRQWKVYYISLDGLYLLNSEARAKVSEVKVIDYNVQKLDLGESQDINLSDLQVILMRKDPPFNIEYIVATYILEKAQEQGVSVFNDPRSLRDTNEKIFTSWVQEICPPGILKRSNVHINKFLETYGKSVIKPIHKMGGQSVYIIDNDDPNKNVIVEDMTGKGENFVQVQKYVPEIETTGDRRIIIIDGEPFPFGIARIPQAGDHRGNMAVGAIGNPYELRETDYQLCRVLGPVLKAKGLLFVGIDVIGEYVTEINVTSPTGIVEINQFFNTNVAAKIIDALVLRLNKT